jgi:hypothetical protein
MRRAGALAGAPRTAGLPAVLAAAAAGALALCAAPAAAVSITATQTPSAPRSVAPTPSPSGSYALGVIRTCAGTGLGGFGGDGGAAIGAGLNGPFGLALDGSGNMLIADHGNHRIRRVAVGTGIITTVAGTGVASFGGDGGPATSASLQYPGGLAVDGSGNVLIADRDNHRIRIVSAATLPSPPPTPSPSTTPYCAPSLFRTLPRTDLVGSLVGTALAPGEPLLAPSEAACRQACCDAASCDGYSFDASYGALNPHAHCYLLVNITQLVPSNGYASGLRESVLL